MGSWELLYQLQEDEGSPFHFGDQKRLFPMLFWTKLGTLHFKISASMYEYTYIYILYICTCKITYHVHNNWTSFRSKRWVSPPKTPQTTGRTERLRPLHLSAAPAPLSFGQSGLKKWSDGIRKVLYWVEYDIHTYIYIFPIRMVRIQNPATKLLSLTDEDEIKQFFLLTFCLKKKTWVPTEALCVSGY